MTLLSSTALKLYHFHFDKATDRTSLLTFLANVYLDFLSSLSLPYLSCQARILILAVSPQLWDTYSTEPRLRQHTRQTLLRCCDPPSQMQSAERSLPSPSFCWRPPASWLRNGGLSEHSCLLSLSPHADAKTTSASGLSFLTCTFKFMGTTVT